MEKIRLVVSDDHPLVLEAIQAMFLFSDIKLVGTATTVKETFEIVESRQPDVLLQDVYLIESQGSELVYSLRRKFPKLGILTMSGRDDIAIDSLLIAGADGFIAKTEKIEVYLEGVEWVARKESGYWLSPSTAEYLRRSADKKMRNLSDSERKVIYYIEYSNKEIAEKLSLGEGTVKNYVASIMVKMGAQSRADIMRIAIQQGVRSV